MKWLITSIIAMLIMLGGVYLLNTYANTNFSYLWVFGICSFAAWIFFAWNRYVFGEVPNGFWAIVCIIFFIVSLIRYCGNINDTIKDIANDVKDIKQELNVEQNEKECK